MHFLCLLVILASTTGAFCHNCLSDNEASFLINGYTTLITNTQTNFNLTLANEILASDYQSTSAGVDYVREEPLNTTTFTSRAQFITQQISEGPFPSVTTLNIYHTCKVIAWRYRLNTLPLPITGITIFIVDGAKQIKTAYYELNVGALLYNLGRPECEGNWTVSA